MAFAPSSHILANYFSPLSKALCVSLEWMQMLEKDNPNHLRPLFRVLTGGLFVFGLYGLFLIISVQYTFIANSGLELGFILSGLLSLAVFIVWVYVSGYVTMYGKLPNKGKSQQSKNT